MPASTPSSEHIADSSVLRAALRREKLALRMAQDEKTRLAHSARIEAHLSALLLPLPPQTISFCAPVRGEFNAGPLAALLIEQGWTIAMPIADAANSPMCFRGWTPSSTMSVDRHGIPIPASGPAIVPGIVLLPLLAFDARGFRLGYGGGYFDRTLAAMVPQPLTIGVGFELGRVADILPQMHDIPLDAIVTETGVMRHAQDYRLLA
jgi:5,10-methenyltetrahydrofolate synthetase